jgi:Ca2+-binding EF-hand superfamily protein
MKRLLPLLAALALTAPAFAQTRDGARLLDQLEKADANKDGAVSKTEFLDLRADQFARIDRNKDGYITDSDIPARAKKRMPELSSDTLRTNFDADKDGRVSRAEFVDGPAMVFDRVDANGDGLATRAEFDAARAALAARP